MNTKKKTLGDPIFRGNDFVIKEKIFSIGKKYIIEDEEGNQIAYCEKESPRLKEDIKIYEDEEKDETLFRIEQKSLTKFTGLFEVLDHTSEGEDVIGYLRRDGFRSLVRDQWSVLDDDKNEIAVLRSDYPLKDLLRFKGLKKIPHRYEIFQDGKKIGVFKQRVSLHNAYRLQIRGREKEEINRKVLISLSICLDAVEKKYRKLKYRKWF